VVRVGEGEAGEERNPEAGDEAGDLAYIMYTSGSTGEPKGGMGSPGNVTGLLKGTQKRVGFGHDRHDDVWTLCDSYGFDFSVWEMWGALLSGGRLVVVGQEERRDPERLHGLMRAEGVTVLNQTPTAFGQLMEADRKAGGGLKVRVVIFGGEA